MVKIIIIIIVHVSGTLPSCVEVADIVPRPFSKVDEREPTFYVTFSKRVSRLNSDHDVFITPSLRHLHRVHPRYSGRYGTSLQQYKFRFELSIYERKMFRLKQNEAHFCHHTVESLNKGLFLGYINFFLINFGGWNLFSFLWRQAI